ncbi:MAG: hypothetical protein A2138_10600 [Deltaproteobacteria bacterium RBG_16_71_12]|nr:MAG: hypothetical protein A2138_10600 [Deltaproteobacteria bacterium RBG_16_71_12]
MSNNVLRALAAIGSTLLAAACAPEFDQPFPLVVGATWTFDTSEAATGATGTKTQTVSDIADGVATLTTNKAGGGTTTSKQQDLEDAVVRLSEESVTAAGAADGSETYHPAKVRVPKTLRTPGEHLTDSYTETAVDAADVETTNDKEEQWTLLEIATVEVAAGSFPNTFHFLRSGAVDKEFWFANGIGKIREEGGGKVEELASYQLP